MPTNKRPAAAKPGPSTKATIVAPESAKRESITDKIRAHVRKSLVEEFDGFILDSSPEEQHFLWEVLQTRGNNLIPGINNIAEAFEIELGMVLCDQKAGA
jgi:hypothetical protein